MGVFILGLIGAFIGLAAAMFWNGIEMVMGHATLSQDQNTGLILIGAIGFPVVMGAFVVVMCAIDPTPERPRYRPTPKVMRRP